MNTKEFFTKTLKDEQNKFRDIIEALPEDQFSHKVHDKGREAGNLAAQLTAQWEAISGILLNGVPTFNAHAMEAKSKSEMLSNFDAGYAELLKNIESISEGDWEEDKGEADKFNGTDGGVISGAAGVVLNETIAFSILTLLPIDPEAVIGPRLTWIMSALLI
jgi:hypothetical protein